MLSQLFSVVSLAGLAAAAPIFSRGDDGPRRLLMKRGGSDRGTVANAHATEAPYFVYYGDKGNGVPDPSTLGGWNTFAVSFWLTEGAWDMAAAWTQLSDADRQAMKQKYSDAGIKLVIAAFGSTDIPTTSGADPVQTANDVAAFAKQYLFDGVDVDYEDFGAMDTGTAVPWLVSFQNALRAAMPDGFISHAPVAPWFTTNSTRYPGGNYLDFHKQAGDSVDLYNLQFYNQGTDAYTDCASLITDSTSSPSLAAFPDSALLQIIASGVPASKLTLGKPGNSGDANNGYMDPQTLAGCVQQAKGQGWNGGLMVWEFPDAIADYVNVVWGS